ncbi:MAG: alpha/beta hydrolase fold domain-containing protein [Lachnospiraceae bacterium]|nr:alpha/beta hydrolase fold domain-containing protein [Lachnospiraceae bacterium]
MGNKALKKLNSEAIKDFVIKKKKEYKKPSTAFAEKDFTVEELSVEGNEFLRIMPRGEFSGTYIFYLYSSYLCFGIESAELNYIVSLAKDTGAGLFIPLYPLAPEFGCKDVFAALKKIYSYCSLSVDSGRMVLMGSSHGAGLALSMALMAWKEGLRKPDQIILLSPAMDTEFFDRDLEKQLLNGEDCDDRYVFSEGIKDFANTYWVKEYAVKTEYTSPIYEDFTDLCDDLLIFSGTGDLLNCYARSFYQKAKLAGVNVRFYEMEYEGHNFMLYNNDSETRKARGLLVDSITGRFTNDYALYELFNLKLMASWSKNFPEVLKDDWLERFMYDNKFNFRDIRTKISEYDNIRLAANVAACDSLVRLFIDEYPNGTIVNVGCRLGNRFARVDNGRVLWYSVDSHNIMSMRRMLYGESAREKTIGRNIIDFSWLDEIVCKRDCGILFCLSDMLSYVKRHQVKELFENIHDRFPGAQVVFNATTIDLRLLDNMRKAPSVMKRRHKFFYVNDAEKLFNNWRIDYRVISEEPVTKYFDPGAGVGAFTKFKLAYNKVSYNNKIIRMRLGSEAYVTDMN